MEQSWCEGNGYRHKQLSLHQLHVCGDVFRLREASLVLESKALWINTINMFFQIDM